MVVHAKPQTTGTFAALPSVVALVAGLLLGILAHQTGWPLLLAFQDLLDPLGQLWLRALQMTVFPLVVLNLLMAILNSSGTTSFGRLGLGTLALFVMFLIAGAALTVTLGSAVIAFIPVDPAASDAIAMFSDRAAELTSGTREQPSFGAWIMSLIPKNPFAALAGGDLLPALVFTLLFGLALTKVETNNLKVATQFFQALCEAIMVLVKWILVFTPVGVFALTAVLATGLGTGALTTIVQYVVLTTGFLILATLLVYPVTTLFGGMSAARFARGVMPAQIVAFSTRSSLASLPALLEGSLDRLKLRPAIANLTLPLSVSVFKFNRSITSTLKLLLIAHIFSIDLSMAQILTFVVSVMLISFSAVGIPLGGGGMKTLPVYVAAGIPLEAYVLLQMAVAIPDIFKTVLNVTADMSVAVIADRWLNRDAAAARAGMPVDTEPVQTTDTLGIARDER